jgi:hypothetical protein
MICRKTMNNRFCILPTCSALWLLLSVACDRSESGSGQTDGAALGGMQSGGMGTATHWSGRLGRDDDRCGHE